jgi:hypothetical protein
MQCAPFRKDQALYADFADGTDNSKPEGFAFQFPSGFIRVIRAIRVPKV